jgi:hypothetical protein
MITLVPFADEPNGAVAIVAALGWIILGVVQLILFIAALVSILGSKRYTGGGKFLWLVVVFFAPLLGAVGWFVVGRRARIRTTEP